MAGVDQQSLNLEVVPFWYEACLSCCSIVIVCCMSIVSCLILSSAIATLSTHLQVEKDITRLLELDEEDSLVSARGVSDWVRWTSSKHGFIKNKYCKIRGDVSFRYATTHDACVNKNNPLDSRTRNISLLNAPMITIYIYKSLSLQMIISIPTSKSITHRNNLCRSCLKTKLGTVKWKLCCHCWSNMGLSLPPLFTPSNPSPDHICLILTPFLCSHSYHFSLHTHHTFHLYLWPLNLVLW